MDFEAMFTRATGKAPYPYQAGLAQGDDWPETVAIPTGAGKTAALTLAWLYRRRFGTATQRASTPRRLVFCQPMRTLVNQTHDAVSTWLHRLELREEKRGIDRGDGVGVHVLMGGAVDDDWHLHPERDAVLIGTQDMLLSRALNRGYAASRFHWPWEFGLLSNDVLWVFDEVQLMGVGLATARQLAAFWEQRGAFGQNRAVFMSATLSEDWLKTVDRPTVPPPFVLGEEDRRPLEARRTAVKRLERARTAIHPGKEETRQSLQALAEEVRTLHQPGSLTLVVLNTVERATVLADHLRASRQGNSPAKQRSRRAKHSSDEAGDAPSLEVVLVHSRFRPAEREAALARATTKDFDGIVVATQVIEAGVDISARTLVTELAPWSSLVQRGGRCNRGGEFADAVVVWVDHALTEEQRKSIGESAKKSYAKARKAWEKQKSGERAKEPLRAEETFFREAIEAKRAELAAPYDASHLDAARTLLGTLKGFSIEEIERVDAAMPLDPFRYVLRRKDLDELFDTTTDLAGADIDVARFLRDGDDIDVQVFWRQFGTAPPSDTRRPSREELCPIPLWSLREWLKAGASKGRRAWRWDAIDGEWRSVASSEVFGGMTLMLSSDAGGYTPTRGWSPDSAEVVPEVVRQSSGADDTEEALGDDPLSNISRWVSLATHSTDARRVAARLTEELDEMLGPRFTKVVTRAAHAHDAGKIHPVFQNTMRAGYTGSQDGPFAKSGTRARHERRGFRHELVSALQWITHGTPDDRDLVAYLLAAHHGKVRCSIRALPEDHAPPEPGKRHARGVWEGESVPAADLGDGLAIPETSLSLRWMEMGRAGDAPSWGERVLRLRNDRALGPFRLAYLEALVRAADVRASIERERSE